MAILRLDRAEIERHAARRGQQGHESLPLLVTVPGSDPGRLAQQVRHVLREVPGGVRTYPTGFGCYVSLLRASEWTTAVDRISLSWADETLPAELEMHVSPPRRATHQWWFAMREGQRPRPAAFLGLTLEPALTERDRDPAGRPYGGWGVAASATRRLVEHAGAWVSASGGEGVVFDGSKDIALLPTDVVEVMSRLAGAASPGFDASFPGTTPGDGGRHVSLDFWGQATYVEAGTHLGDATVAREMGAVLRHHAPGLDVGAVRLGQAGATRNFGYDDELWWTNRHLWASRVQQPHAIQVLTSAHLELAHELSGWSVESVAEDRWLVAAEDVEPWFPTSDDVDRMADVPTEIMASAVRDFGDMLLTPEVAAANPLPQRSEG
ncbi:hypothetical protein GCM10011376_18590 [Nocardioides flavus (ex Wang et al. 2016)]|uniref:Uncharacterized protein n=1 Tax=Nocardioides flavus (ex Wang et al. 2016) TaxID=2058780 RepID=A0ABQ3HM88_9ACTN|nr:hypothetical protein [Nocardioides flavus (ex Wang et al. 2016)]GHE17249.1 hypothetical protein GCM10011376_18590 [Nocardioides flavus (ex Wang et al. 2016)]